MEAPEFVIDSMLFTNNLYAVFMLVLGNHTLLHSKLYRHQSSVDLVVLMFSVRGVTSKSYNNK